MQRELEIGLLESVPDSQRAAELESLCAEIVAAIETKWPLGWVDGITFGRYLAHRRDPGVELGKSIFEMFVADLYLACAVGQGVRAAMAALEQMITTDLPPAIRTVQSDQDAIAEVLQLLRERLLVRVNGSLRLEQYSGLGPLGGWLRVSALRIALSQRRQAKPAQIADDELDAILDLAPNAEIKVIANQLRSELRAALRSAIAAQPARVRVMLRLYYADGHGVEEIGRALNVHFSTVSRCLAKARADILDHTRSELITRLGTPPSQVDSVLGHAASLEISLESLLRSND